jgi:hypothetical protein
MWVFDPLRLDRGIRAKQKGDTSIVVWQLVVYVFLVAGIGLSTYFAGFRGGTTEWEFSPGAFVFALIVGFILLPGVVDSSQPPAMSKVLLELSKAFTYGIGWESLIDGIIKAVSGG